MEVIFSLLLFIFILYAPSYFKFKGSNYKDVSGNTYFKTIFDKGNYGEFLTFVILEKLEGYHKLMANLYLPKKDGTTTEIDLVMLSETGVYVFESKNYSGWIFGDEANKNWTQTLNSRKKCRFFNPIWQNSAHINALKVAIGNGDNKLYKSYIIFSKRCTLKKINVTSNHVKVIKRNQLINTIKNDIMSSENVLTPQEIDQIYAELLKYAHADGVAKQVHVSFIKNKKIR
ncbi:nuclease-like protein [Schinkia azotoformans MEV2011]|uniref:Nuclease-like protein n=1 Tax=Schinkia azotoformans MEV2011 TaxID=1348973 RepID=A0A072NF34_SCHAZ|nr:nuclease-related domain-containing protein [Schinkia azotoformans]KEF35847.1 nuclease-like protein [Schinkia azotoformans MEV2011]MEC1698310.1 nuclease-related domain-containing protein [Schinkia azotoformans]MEC1726005.1 nuclease-related domain-containing protein [Schinkia azotoformans]MEC1772733.1 nuclease-related domain-containing protein [Schinkia azotoformans]MEC1782324.1 nuclease-related domain-containing protein [Schinkia azotoformans]